METEGLVPLKANVPPYGEVEMLMCPTHLAIMAGPVEGVSMAEAKGTWYFTFGVGMEHAGRFYKVENATDAEARAQMVKVFGTQWGFQYGEKDWYRDGISQEERYGLKEIK